MNFPARIRVPHFTAVIASIALALLAACGKDEKVQCDPAAQTGCASGSVCETVENGTPACFDPVLVKGEVFDLVTQRALGQTRLVALDVNRAPVSAVSTSGADGTYSLGVPSRRNSDGAPVSAPITLRADRTGYQSFPGGVRIAIPFDLSSAAHASGAWTVQVSGLTDVGLAASTPTGTASIHGTVGVPPIHGGVLVVAEPAAGGAGITGIADRSGSYAIFNLPGGATYNVTPYAAGVNYTPGTVSLVAGDDKQVDISIGNSTTATVTGSVNPVGPNASGLPTSLILVVKSTFNALGRGDAPPGLRDPASGLGVTSAFSIIGVPNGTYVALAAFENDGLVRDVATTGGTAPLEVVVSHGVMTSAAGSFKITSPVNLTSPAPTDASGAALGMTLPLQFAWDAYSATNHYGVTVYDTFGNVQWSLDDVPPTSNTVSVRYGQGGSPNPAPALVPGMYYQVRVEAFGTQSTQYTRTEDFKGVFTVQ
jgi:hypothetical protein